MGPLGLPVRHLLSQALCFHHGCLEFRLKVPFLRNGIETLTRFDLLLSLPRFLLLRLDLGAHFVNLERQGVDLALHILGLGLHLLTLLLVAFLLGCVRLELPFLERDLVVGHFAQRADGLVVAYEVLWNEAERLGFADARLGLVQIIKRDFDGPLAAQQVIFLFLFHLNVTLLAFDYFGQRIEMDRVGGHLAVRELAKIVDVCQVRLGRCLALKNRLFELHVVERLEKLFFFLVAELGLAAAQHNIAEEQRILVERCIAVLGQKVHKSRVRPALLVAIDLENDVVDKLEALERREDVHELDHRIAQFHVVLIHESVEPLRCTLRGPEEVEGTLVVARCIKARHGQLVRIVAPRRLEE